MSNGFGAGFLALAVLAVLATLAAGLLLLAVGTAALRRARGRVPDALDYLAAALLAAVVAVAVFGVVATLDEAPLAAVPPAVLVAVPLALAAGRARWRGATWLDAAVTAAFAWSGPYLVAVGVFVGALAAGSTFAVAVTAAGAAAVVGALAAGEYLRGEAAAPAG